jgi:hypothetical protein
VSLEECTNAYESHTYGETVVYEVCEIAGELCVLSLNSCDLTPYCGDAECNGEETCNSCYVDCGCTGCDIFEISHEFCGNSTFAEDCLLAYQYGDGYYFCTWEIDTCIVSDECFSGMELYCDDEIDNDNDEVTDCLDDDCDGVDSCEYAAELTCDDTIDNDGDGDTDCDDDNCAADPACDVLECGDTVTEDLTLTGNLSCSSSDGLRIGVSDITIDCDGYSLIGAGEGYGIDTNGYNNFTIINCEISEFIMGINVDSAESGNITDCYLYNNSCDGIYLINSEEVNVIDTVLENNAGECAMSGLHLLDSHVNLWNSEFVNNSEYGIHDEEARTINWTIDDYALCRNNALLFGGEIIFDGGVLELDNCSINITDSETNITTEWDIDGNFTDITFGEEVEENETETFEFSNSDLEIDLTANETYNFSISVRLLNSTEVNDTNPNAPTDTLPFKGMTIEVIDTDYLSWSIIRLYYNSTELDELNIDEDSLRMYYFNETSEEWELVVQQGIVKTDPKHVWGNVTHFSTYAIFGEEAEEDEPSSNSPGGSGGAPVGKKNIIEEDEETELIEEEQEEIIEEIEVPEKPEVPEILPEIEEIIKPIISPQETQEEQKEDNIFYLPIIIILIILIAIIFFIAYRKKQIKKHPLKGKRIF